MNQSLYEITSELAPLEAALEAAGGDVTESPDLLARVTELMTARENKIEGYGKVWRNLEKMIDTCQDEEKRLRARRLALQNRLDRLKEAAKIAMEMSRIIKIEGPTFMVYLQRNGKAPVNLLERNTERLPVDYVRVTKEPDLEKIREALESGDQEIKKYAELGDVGTSVRLR